MKTLQKTTDEKKDGQELKINNVGSNLPKLRLQDFVKQLNALPAAADLVKTPDGRAQSLGISFIEMQLDELFFGLWSTTNFHHAVITNEIVGSIELTVIHPINGMEVKRIGTASIQIMVDKGSNPLDVNNKKANALDMGFPKLKAECLKNAAQSLGKIFGRDLNRKQADSYTASIKLATDELVNMIVDSIEKGTPMALIAPKIDNYSFTEDQLARINSTQSNKQLQ